MLGTRLNAEKAQALGLVNQAVAPEQLASSSQKLAEQLAQRSALSLAYIKDNIHRGQNLSFSRILRRDEVAFIDTACTEQAVTAYKLQKSKLAAGYSVNQSFDEHEQVDLNASQE